MTCLAAEDRRHRLLQRDLAGLVEDDHVERLASSGNVSDTLSGLISQTGFRS